MKQDQAVGCVVKFGQYNILSFWNFRHAILQFFEVWSKETQVDLMDNTIPRFITVRP